MVFDLALWKVDLMMKRNKLFGAADFCAINFAAHLCFYGSLPDVVPTHWGVDGQANGWGQIHCADYGSPARPDADFDGSAAPH